jgi:hypothetical protein
MKFDKQKLEDQAYDLASAAVNAFYKELLTGPVEDFNRDTLQMVRQFMDAMHFAVTENIVQIIHGANLFNENTRKEGK